MNNLLIKEVTTQIDSVQRDYSKINELAQWAFNKKQELKSLPQYNHLNFLLYLYILDVLWNINGGIIWDELKENDNLTDSAISVFEEDFDMILKYSRGEKIYQEVLLVQEDFSSDDLSKSIIFIAKNLVRGNFDININISEIEAMKDTFIDITRRNIVRLETIKVIKNILCIHKEGLLLVNSIGLMNAALDMDSELEKLRKLVLLMEGKIPYRLSIGIRQFNIIYVNFEIFNNNTKS